MSYYAPTGQASAKSAGMIEKRAKPDPDEAALHEQRSVKYMATRRRKRLDLKQCALLARTAGKVGGVPDRDPRTEFEAAWQKRNAYLREVGMYPERAMHHDD